MQDLCKEKDNRRTEREQKMSARSERGSMSRFFGPACGQILDSLLSKHYPSSFYYKLTATLRDARDGTLSSVEWRYRSTVALAASTAVGASEAMPTTANSAASAAKRADGETILFLRGYSK